MKLFYILPFILFFSSTVFASDHIDGPITSKHSVSDLTDLFVFPTPEKQESLTLIMNSYPMVPVKGHFEERLSYIFKIRKAEIKGQEAITSDESTIVCKFKAPHDKDKNWASCSINDGASINGKINIVNESSGMKMWAGMRSDPFFFNSDWALSASTEGKIIEPKNRNVMDKLNILSVVLEVDIDRLFSTPTKSSLYAVMAEIRFVDDLTSEEKLLDRVGRPEITNVSLVANGGDEDLRDVYNVGDTFNLGSSERDKYIDRLYKNIGYYDSLDSNSVDWNDLEKKTFAKILVDDFLLVDLSRACVEGSFLSIEKAMLEMKSYDNCGGRQLTDDIMDDMFGMFINKGQKPVRDGVDSPYREVSPEFPYLAKPDTNKMARLKAYLARKFAK